MRLPPRLLVLPFSLFSAACSSDGTTAPEAPASIAFTAAPDSIFALSDTLPLTVIVKSESGNELPGIAVSFSSSAEDVAVVTSSGRLVSKGTGTVRITATAGSLQAFADVAVRQKLSSIALSRSTLRLGAGRSATLSAAPIDSRGNTIPGLPAAAFSAADTTVVRVSGSGVSTGLRPGTTRVTARITSSADGTREQSADVTVVAVATNPVVGMGPASFSPATVDIAAGGTVRFVNQSGVAHDVDFAGAFEKIPVHTSGESSRTFAAAGAFPFHCNLHGGMTGTVFVSP